MDTGRCKIFGERLRARRQALDLRQQDLAAQMGVAQGWISELETGKQKRLEAETVCRFAEKLHCSADYLLGLTETRSPATTRQRSRKAAPVN